MDTSIKLVESLSENKDRILLITDDTDLSALTLRQGEADYISRKKSKEGKIIPLNRLDSFLFVVVKPEGNNTNTINEKIRKQGHELAKLLKAEKIEAVELTAVGSQSAELLALAEGLLLSSYEFNKYKSEQKSPALTSVALHGQGLTAANISELEAMVKGVFTARSLVNEPVIYLTATQLSEEIEALGKEAGFSVDVFSKNKIESLKMGGLLAVNAGSVDPPTFTVMEYNPENAANSQPVILVGKGVVYDTGGLSLKPTPGSMDAMKCDMAGAAAVVGAIYAIAKNKLPVHVIGLIPATDNRPGGNAITPGDVITMHSGKTVEILNTDAEGRLILADALCYAQKFNPALVIDLATLTGSAARAIGKEGIVYMGTADEQVKNNIEASGYTVHERLVEFPLWDEYESQIKSDIADIKNLGGPDAGAITAGMFLKHFTNYPWLHLDIAGPAFLASEDSYRGKNGTGTGVRLLYNYLKSYIAQ
jgi:leucyl aminopeptidase